MRPLLLLAVVHLIVLADAKASASTAALGDDVLGLIVFKAEVADPAGRLASWREDDENPCGWAGVTCDPRTGRVAELSLAGFGLSGKLGHGLLRLEALKSISLPRNNLSGELPANLTRLLPNLQALDLSSNALSGPIPDGFFRQGRSLRDVSLAGNSLSGGIPRDVAACATLASLNLSSNRLSDALPSGIWSMNALRELDLSSNAIAGDIPVGISRMFNLRALNLRNNRHSGDLPDDIGNCFLLNAIDLGSNSLSGNLPESLRKLSTCTYLDLSSNGFTGDVPTWVGEMASLETLDLSGNSFSGEIPASIGELTSLKELRLSGNRLTGRLPESLGGCRSLVHVDVSWNSLTGRLPAWVFASGVQWVSVSDNTLSGEIQLPVNAPSSASLRGVDLSSNAFSGSIPVEVSWLRSLRLLNMSWNSLSGSIPASIGGMRSLELLDLTGNRLNGSVPSTIGADTSLKELKVGRNSLTGEIPAQIGNCSSLASLDLSQNNLTGAIPATMANLTNLETVDLSRNKLTGGVPKQLSNLPHLRLVNFSHNLLSGDLPPGAFFDTISPSSVSGNPGLCGAKLNSSCPAVVPKPIVLNPNSTSNPMPQPEPVPDGVHHKKIILSISAIVAIGAAALITLGVVAIAVLNIRARAPDSRSADALALSDGYLSQSPTTDVNAGKLVMFGDGHPEFSATAHALLNKDCELGRGGFGTVYKATLRDGQPVAIKKLTVSSMVKSQDEFEREVKVMAKLRHCNLVALRGYYWTPSLQLLIYEFVPGGNLHKHLHESSNANCLSWKERFDIVLGVARSLAHLHQHNVVHYNLKSSNILLDGSGEAKVADYGLAKLLPMLDRYVLSSKAQSAIGYMAPEFACRAAKITAKCDVYGFGVLVLETLTGRRPVEDMEDDMVVLCDVVRAALDEGSVGDCVDGRLCGKFPPEEAVPVMKLGLVCTSQVPSSRPDMSEVVSILELIRCPQDSPDAEFG